MYVKTTIKECEFPLRKVTEPSFPTSEPENVVTEGAKGVSSDSDNEFVQQPSEDVGPKKGFTRSGRMVRPPERFGCPLEDFEEVHFVDSADTPVSYEQALRSEQKAEWLKAMQVEYDALMANGTWVLDCLPPGKKALSSRWVFAVKKDKDGNIEKFKARFVARGFGQVYGSDYVDTFAPTAKLSSIRIYLACSTNF